MNRPNCFAILVSPKNFFLCAENEEEMTNWMNCLQVFNNFKVFFVKFE